jgi:hypothetical protein
MFPAGIGGGRGIEDFERMDVGIPPIESDLDGTMEGVEGGGCWDGERAADARIGDIEEIDLKEIVGQIPWRLFMIRHDQERD